MAERFGTFENVDAAYFMQNAKNENTEKCTIKWMRCYWEWAKCREKPSKIEEESPEALNSILKDFFTEVRKKDGTDYEPCSLLSLQTGIDRYLRGKKYKFSILKSREFQDSKDFLEGKARIYAKYWGKEKDL